MKLDSNYPLTIRKWWPSVNTLDAGETAMLWELDLESRYREDGGFTSPVDLSYQGVQVKMQWLSGRKCSLYCHAPASASRKDLVDSGYRGILAIDRYVGRVASITGVERAAWWVAIFTVYGAFGGPQSYDANELMKAAAKDDVQRLEELLGKGADIEAGDMVGTNALACAAQSGALRAFKLLQGKGANPSVVTSGGGTLLHAAAAGGNVEIASILLSSGLDLNASAQSGHTPLGWAILNGKAEMAEYFLRAGADPKAERGIHLCHEAQSRLGENHPVTKLLCP